MKIKKIDENFVKTNNICEICHKYIKADTKYTLNLCSHDVHKECIAETIKKNLLNKVFNMPCPKDKCTLELNIFDLNAIMGPDNISKILKEQLKYKGVDEYYLCQTKECQFLCPLSKAKSSNRFECPFCKAEYCTNCNEFFHPNKNCTENKKTSVVLFIL